MSGPSMISAREACEIIKGLGDTVICTHRRPDGDTVGTAAALALLLREMGKRAVVTCADGIPERLEFVLAEGTAVSPEEARELKDKGWSVVSVDVASPFQLGALYDVLPEQELVIDHHSVSSPFARTYCLPDAPSASFVLYGLVTELCSEGKDYLTHPVAEAIYTALSSDTGCFRFSNATPDAHLVAARLLAVGVDGARINRLLFDSKPKGQIRAEGFIAAGTTVLDSGISYASVTLDDLATLGLDSEHFETAIDVVRSVRGTEIAIVAKETERGSYKISLRSTETDVASIAARFGGGGHIRASGCTVSAQSANEAIERVIAELKKA